MTALASMSILRNMLIIFPIFPLLSLFIFLFFSFLVRGKIFWIEKKSGGGVAADLIGGTPQISHQTKNY